MSGENGYQARRKLTPLLLDPNPEVRASVSALLDRLDAPWDWEQNGPDPRQPDLLALLEGDQP